jgi:hypothetical protein
MSRSTYPLKPPPSIKNAAQKLAKEDAVSLNQWISVAVAQKIGLVETAATFFERKAKGATRKTLGDSCGSLQIGGRSQTISSPLSESGAW